MSDGNVRVLTAGGAAHPNLVNRGGVAGKGPKSKSKTSKKGGNAAEDISVDDNDKAFAFPSNKDSVRDNGVEPTENVSLEYETSGGRVSNDKNNNSTATQTTVGDGNDNRYTGGAPQTPINDMTKKGSIQSRLESEGVTPVKIEDLYQEPPQSSKARDLIWLFICFVGIMASFVLYGLLLEYTTSGGRKLHELSFLFVTSGLYTITAAAGRYVRGETPTTIPPPRFAILGLTSMGSTFTSVRSLRYVIYPIQVLAKSCKPVPVMLMGTLMGKRYDLRKYINVVMIVLGVALFMGGGSSSSKSKGDDEKSASSQLFGIFLLFLSLCFDGGTGAYEDKLMSVHSVQPFDLMYNIQLGKTILAGVSLLVRPIRHLVIYS
jgi:UDP-galactose transporter B1